MFFLKKNQLNIRSEEIEDPPRFNALADADYILGMAKREDGVKILLDMDRVLAGQDAAMIGSMA